MRFTLRRRDAAPWAAALIAALAAWSVLGRGVPALRQDWFFSARPDALPATLAWYASGWSAFGLGSPQAYPTLYPFAAPLGLVAALTRSPLAVVGVAVFGGLYAAARAAIAYGRDAGLSTRAAIALGAVAALNPWVYTEEAAGHPYMVAAYAVALVLLAEAARPRPREAVLCLGAALCVTQLEFALLIAPPLIVWALRRGRRAPVAVLLAFAAPIAYGILAGYGAVRGTPYGFDWERWESVPFFQGLLLDGYGAGYGAPFLALWSASLALALVAARGVAEMRGRAGEIALVVGALAAAVYASGASGAFGWTYRWIVLHVPESGVYRELYDLIAVVAVGLLVALRRACLASRPARLIVAAAALGLALPWLRTPVFAWSVPAAAIPDAAGLPAVAALGPQARYLLEPAFQPLSLRGAGSGTDPDAFPTLGGPTPLNEWFPSFPVDAALGYATRDGDDRRAAALGAALVVRRPHLRSDARALAGQGVRLRERAAPASVEIRSLAALDPMPALALLPPPLEAAIGDDPAENALFFGDRRPEAIRRFAPDPETHDPRLAWVDARPSTPAEPENGTALGGVATTGGAELAVPFGTHVLARARGALRTADGRLVVAGRGGPYRWYALPAGAPRRLVCAGACAVAASGDPPPGLPEHAYAPRGATRPVALRMLAPWLGVATLDARDRPDPRELRLNARYAPQWIALCDGRLLVHERLDAAVNGWRLPAGRGATLYLVEGTAAVQTMLELLAAGVLAAVLTRAAARRRAS